jgi:hypothetical protein
LENADWRQLMPKTYPAHNLAASNNRASSTNPNMGPSKKKCRLVAGSQGWLTFFFDHIFILTWVLVAADPHARHNNDANDTSRHRHHHHSQKDDQEDSPDLPPQLSCCLRVGDSDSESDSDSTTLKSSEECVDSRQEEDLVNLNNEALQQSLRNEVSLKTIFQLDKG